jgi:hypothetical protein
MPIDIIEIALEKSVEKIEFSIRGQKVQMALTNKLEGNFTKVIHV